MSADILDQAADLATAMAECSINNIRNLARADLHTCVSLQRKDGRDIAWKRKLDHG